MSDSSGDDKAAAIPSWQASASSSDAPAPAADKQTEDTLAVARRFLQEEQVQSAPREKQVSFLKTKGVSDEDIERLLGEAKKPEADEVSQPSAQPKSSHAKLTPSSKSLNHGKKSPLLHNQKTAPPSSHTPNSLRSPSGPRPSSPRSASSTRYTPALASRRWSTALASTLLSQWLTA